jgi:hypothetical protein
MRCAQKSGMKWLRTIVAAVTVLGLMAVISPPVGLAQPGDNIEQKIRDAKTPADHQALAAWYEQEAQAAHQLASRYFVMRDVLAAARAVEQKNRAGERRRCPLHQRLQDTLAVSADRRAMHAELPRNFRQDAPAIEAPFQQQG